MQSNNLTGETHQPEGIGAPTHRARGGGVRARLLLAFFGIAAFAALAAAAALYAFREVGRGLELVDARVPPGISAIELTRSAERLIAAAPALVATTDPLRRDGIQARIQAEIRRLNNILRTLESPGAGHLPLFDIESMVVLLLARLEELDSLTARRMAAGEHIANLRAGVFGANAGLQRLLAPWLTVLHVETSALVGAMRGDAPPPASGDALRLAESLRLQRAIESVQQHASTLVDLLSEVSTSAEPERMRILRFQMRLGLQALDEAADGLDARLEPLVRERLAGLAGYVDGASSIAEARERELALTAAAERTLSRTRELSDKLTAAVDQLGRDATGDISSAVQDALEVQRRSAQILVALAALSLLTSIAIVWRYVSGNIVRRLTALSDAMRAISGGRVQSPVRVDGDDEIAAMGRAVEVLRRNTLERDALLAQKAQAAETLEREVRQRTAELEVANRFKSRFLAAASHDLRQPLHALNLFVAQLHDVHDGTGRARLVARIEAAVASMNELFDALLDMSRLEAGTLTPSLSEFPVARLLQRLEATYADAAREKGLHLRVVYGRAWVRSDFVLLERILFNLVSNAVRYTHEGGIVIGCRPRGARVRFDVCDTGPGIPPDRRKAIFREFYQLAPGPGDRSSGLGLGLDIVEGLSRLLDCPVELESRPGRGSRFSVSVPRARAAPPGDRQVPGPVDLVDPLPGKQVVVIDDEALVLDAMRGILEEWGCRVVAAATVEAAVEGLRGSPDLVISDFRLTDGRGGIDAIARMRKAAGAAVPALLITGDTAPERLREARASGLHLLYKPIAPMALRAMLDRLLRARVGDTGR